MTGEIERKTEDGKGKEVHIGQIPGFRAKKLAF